MVATTRVWPERRPAKHVIEDAVERLSPDLWLKAELGTGVIHAQDTRGVSRWSLSLELCFGKDRGIREPRPSATIATAECWVVDRGQADDEDWWVALDDISSDVSYPGFAFRQSLGIYGHESPVSGYQQRLLIVHDLVVDTYWRGSGVGPAVVHHAAATLGCEISLLIPVVLATKVDRDGTPYSSYTAPRDLAALPKVVRAYRRGGFVKLHHLEAGEADADGRVVMYALTEECLAKADKRLAYAEQVAALPAARSWYLRRARQRSAARNTSA